MPEPRIRVVGQARSEPDFKVLARAIIELARFLAEEEQPNEDSEPSDGEES